MLLQALLRNPINFTVTIQPQWEECSILYAFLDDNNHLSLNYETVGCKQVLVH